MEALGALSVAAAVVQFVEFGGKAVLKGREIYKSADGALVENQALDDYSGMSYKLLLYYGGIHVLMFNFRALARSCRQSAKGAPGPRGSTTLRPFTKW